MRIKLSVALVRPSLPNPQTWPIAKEEKCRNSTKIINLDASALGLAFGHLDTRTVKPHVRLFEGGMNMTKPHELFETLKDFELGDGKKGRFYSLPELEKQGIAPISKLPVCLRIVLESVLRNFDSKTITEE